MRADLASTVNSPITPGSAGGQNARSSGGHSDDSIVESLHQELGGKVNREQVRSAVRDAHAHFRDATVRTYLPILIRRYVLDRLS